MACLKGLFWDCYCLSCTLIIYLNPLHFILSVLYTDDTYRCLSQRSQTFWILGQIRDLIRVCGPDCFVHWKSKTKKHTHDIRNVCTLQFFSVFDNMFAMWLLQQLLLLNGSRNIWFHAWCSYILIASTIFKNPAYLTNQWLDSKDVVQT